MNDSVKEERTYKVQTDFTGKRILLYTKGRNNLRQMEGPDAIRLIRHLKMGPMEKIYVVATVEEDSRDKRMMKILNGKVLSIKEQPDW